MMKEKYQKQVKLLLSVLPEVAKESCFALHGGTAINLYVRDMPRLSIDIDLTYIPIEARAQSIENMNNALARIKGRLEQIFPNLKCRHENAKCKLFISTIDAEIKIELNMVGRGLIGEPQKLLLCNKAEVEYDAFVAMNVMPFGQLYGGKLCAALDRQHPRDIFDTKLLLENEGLSSEVMKGFVLSLVSNDRPIVEVLRPNLLDQRSAMSNQFEGMSDIPFTYDDYETTRKKIILLVNDSLTSKDKEFLLSVKRLTPNWSAHEFENFPAVRWKMLNLEKLRANNPNKYHNQLKLLEEHLVS